jgi:uncharacterized oxidoreductase
MTAAGTPKDIAVEVSRHLVNAGLAGYDSHGIMQVPGYLAQIADGRLNPRARPTVDKENASTAAVNAHEGWGPYAAHEALVIAMGKARETGVSVVTLGRSSHIGRLGQYAEDAAAAGLISIVTFGEGQAGKLMAVPFGSRQPGLATNPFAAGVPVASGTPFITDFATTKVANASTWRYQESGEPLPEGVALDRDGDPTRDAAAYLDGGSLIILGGHKGSGLSILIALLGGLASSELVEAQRPHLRGATFLVIDPEAFAAVDYPGTVSAFLASLRRLKPAREGMGVLVPGDMEALSRARRQAEGIPMSSSVRADITKLCRQVGVEDDLS